MKDSIIRAQFPPAVRQQPCFCFDKKQRVISRQLSIQMGWIQLSYCVTIIWIWFVKDTDSVIGGVSCGDGKLFGRIGGAVCIEGAGADGDTQDSEGQLGT